MSDSEFFRLDQEQWYAEFVEHELPANPTSTNAHNEIFEFEDIPF